MSSHNNNSSRDNSDDEGSDELLNNNCDAESSEDEKELQWTTDTGLYEAVNRCDAAGVQKALRNGANVNGHSGDNYDTALTLACKAGYDEIVRILLNAGANVWLTSRIHSVMENAILGGHLSTAEILLNHDKDLLEIENSYGGTSLLVAIYYEQIEIAHLLLDRGANALVTNDDEATTLILACQRGADLELVRQLLAAGVAVEARDESQRTALHHAAVTDGNTDVMRLLIVEHNANMFAVNDDEETPFDSATHYRSAAETCAFFIECYGNKLTQEHGRLALHAVLAAAEYSFADARGFHPPQNPLRIRLPLGKLTLNHFRTLLSSLDAEMIRNADKSGMLPIQVACHSKAPVEVLALIAEQDAATLHVADYAGELPLHECCSGAVDDSSVRFLVEQGGVGTLAARNQEGAMPLHVLCRSQNPPLQTVRYMIESFSGSVAAQTNAGQYPFMIAACESSEASLCVIYELVRANPDLVTPN